MQSQTENRKALCAKGLAFIAQREAYVASPGCLESIIMALISKGAITRSDIVRQVPRYVGHSYAHVASTLDRGCGDDPIDFYWTRDSDKNYRLHPTT